MINFLIKILNFCKLNSIDIFAEGESNLFYYLSNKQKYLPIQLFLKKLKLNIYKEACNIEIDNFLNNFYDIEKFKIHFEDEFHNLIDQNLLNIFDIMYKMNLIKKLDFEKGKNNQNNNKENNNKLVVDNKNFNELNENENENEYGKENQLNQKKGKI
jgi:hypothetical protein